MTYDGRAKTEVWDSIALDLISVQVEGEIVFINTAGAKMLGAATPVQLIGKPMLDFIHPCYREIAAERVRQMTIDGIVVCPSEEKWLRLDGTTIDVMVLYTPAAEAEAAEAERVAKEVSNFSAPEEKQ